MSVNNNSHNSYTNNNQLSHCRLSKTNIAVSYNLKATQFYTFDLKREINIRTTPTTTASTTTVTTTSTTTVPTTSSPATTATTETTSTTTTSTTTTTTTTTPASTTTTDPEKRTI